MGGNPVQEPAIVRDHNRAAREFEQCVLQAGEGFHIEVVGGLVEEQKIAALLQGQGEVQPVPLSA